MSLTLDKISKKKKHSETFTEEVKKEISIRPWQKSEEIEQKKEQDLIDIYLSKKDKAIKKEKINRANLVKSIKQNHEERVAEQIKSRANKIFKDIKF